MEAKKNAPAVTISNATAYARNPAQKKNTRTVVMKAEVEEINPHCVQKALQDVQNSKKLEKIIQMETQLPDINNNTEPDIDEKLHNLDAGLSRLEKVIKSVCTQMNAGIEKESIAPSSRHSKIPVPVKKILRNMSYTVTTHSDVTNSADLRPTNFSLEYQNNNFEGSTIALYPPVANRSLQKSCIAIDSPMANPSNCSSICEITTLAAPFNGGGYLSLSKLALGVKSSSVYQKPSKPVVRGVSSLACNYDSAYRPSNLKTKPMVEVELLGRGASKHSLAGGSSIVSGGKSQGSYRQMLRQRRECLERSQGIGNNGRRRCVTIENAGSATNTKNYP